MCVEWWSRVAVWCTRVPKPISFTKFIGRCMQEARNGEIHVFHQLCTDTQFQPGMPLLSPAFRHQHRSLQLIASSGWCHHSSLHSTFIPFGFPSICKWPSLALATPKNHSSPAVTATVAEQQQGPVSSQQCGHEPRLRPQTARWWSLNACKPQWQPSKPSCWPNTVVLVVNKYQTSAKYVYYLPLLCTSCG